MAFPIVGTVFHMAPGQCAVPRPGGGRLRRRPPPLWNPQNEARYLFLDLGQDLLM